MKRLENEERLREIAYQGRQRVLEGFSFSAQRERYLDLFSRLVPASEEPAKEAPTEATPDEAITAEPT